MEKFRSPKCKWCGKFVNIHSDKVNYKFTPDSELSIEEEYWEHETCEKSKANQQQ